MRAIVSRNYGTPDVLSIEEVATPVPGAGELLVRNHASVVTAAMCHARSGSPFSTRLYFGLRRPKWPILGTVFSGEVEAIGSAVTRFRAGDRVSGVNVTDFGAHAEYVVVGEDGVVVPTPANLTHPEAAAVFDGSVTALPFLRDTAGLGAGQSILVNGASGAVGTAAVQLAKYYGATVTAVCSTGNVALARSLGADTVIDYTADDFTLRRDAYDVIFDTVASSSFGRSRRALKRGGIYLTTEPTPPIFAQMLWTSRIGSRRAAVTLTGLAKPAVMTENIRFIAELASSGRFAPVIGRTFAMEQGAEAHRLVDSGRKTGSAVITLAA
ncbi:NAD(P)-dependent alcohol dehydrogenase [Glaciibacter sp. 2TAF33]|uniref:NAD(P)-dependent alcohol dehydrogenase n=1 Tax=Glaciibacter sp. 2TAF33 TaxID=3233015 RepID=UPI003F9133BB